MTSHFSALFKRVQSVASFAGPSMLDQTIVSGLNFLVGVYLAYALGMSEFGQFSLILVVTFFCLEMQRAFVLAPMMTFMAKKNEEGYARSVLLIMLIGAVVLGLAGGAFINISGHFFPMWGIADQAAPAVLLIISRTAQEFLRRFLFVHDKPYRALVIDATVAMIIVVGLIVLKMSDALNVYHVLVLHGLAYCFGYMMGFTALHSGNQWPRNDVLWQNTRRHWIFGRWLVAGVVATYASSNLLLLTGAAELGSQAAGLIKAAQYLMGGMIILFQAMENIIPYRMAQLTENTPREMKQFLLKTLGGMMAFCVIHGCVIYLFIDPITHWIAPGNESEMRPLAIINIFFTMFLVITYCLQYLLRALERTNIIFWANTVTAVFSLLFGSLLIREFGVIGISYGLFAIQIIVQVICIYSVRSFLFRAS